MANQIFSRLRGTFLDIFRIGKTGGVNLKANSGNLHIRNQADDAFARIDGSQVKILGSNASNGVVLSAPNSLSGTTTFTLPGTDGAANQVLSTNGIDGTLSWINVSSDADITVAVPFSQADSTVPILSSPPDDAVLKEFRIIVPSNAGGGTPSLTIGVSGQVSKYVEAGDVDLLTSAEYIISLYEELGTSPADIIATVTASGQTFSGTIVMTYVVS